MDFVEAHLILPVRFCRHAPIPQFGFMHYGFFSLAAKSTVILGIRNEEGKPLSLLPLPSST